MTNYVVVVFFSHSTACHVLNVTTSAEVYSESPGGGLVPTMPYIYSSTNKIIPPLNWTQSFSTGTFTADTIYYTPQLIVPPLDKRDNVGGACVTKGSTGGTKFRLGLYDIGTDGLPNNLLAQTADKTPAATSISGTWTAINVPAGWYYVAWVCDGSPTIDRMNGSTSAITNPLGASGANSVRSRMYCTESNASIVLPATATASGFGPNQAPRVILQGA